MCISLKKCTNILQAVTSLYLRICCGKKKMRANKLQNVFVKFQEVIVASLLYPVKKRSKRKLFKTPGCFKLKQ